MAKGKPLTAEQKQQIVDLYQSGRNTTQIAQQMGLTGVTASRLIKSLGLTRSRAITEQQRAQIVAAYNAGKSSLQIGAELGLSSATVAKVVRQAGTTRGAEYRAARDKQIVEEYQRGASTIELAAKFSLYDSQIFLIVKNAGVLRAQKRIAPEQKAAIVVAYLSGKSSTEVATEFGVCSVSVQKLVKSAGHEVRRRVITEDERRAVVDAYIKSGSSVKTAKTTGISKPMVLSICREAGLPVVNKRLVSCHLPADEIVAAHQSGETTIEIGKRYGAEKSVIGRLLKKAGFRLDDLSVLSPLQRQARKNRYAQHALRQRGENSHRWKGGRTDLRALIRPGAKYKAWRLSVFQRDNFTCQHCGRKDSSIQADHIYPFSRILDDHQITTLEQADECAALWDVDNGRTLCEPCHRKTPTWGSKLQRKTQQVIVT